MAQTWTLAEIRAKIRKLTGRPTTAQITDDEINDYIDNYYLNVLPLQIDSSFLDKFSSGGGFTGTTSLDVGEYPLPASVVGLKKPVIFDGEEIPLSFDLQKFLLDFPPGAKIVGSVTESSTQGDLDSFVYTALQPSITPGTVSIRDSTGTAQVVRDNGSGGFIGDVAAQNSGSIDYDTGVMTFAWAATSINPTIITYDSLATVDTQTPGRPHAALLWERKLWFRPIPDDNNGANYIFEAAQIEKPSSLETDSQQPVSQLFGPVLAYGASIDIFVDDGESDQAGGLTPILKNYISLIFRKDVTAEIGRSAFPNF